jgi:ligand-binding sensor domain-containing protein
MLSPIKEMADAAEVPASTAKTAKPQKAKPPGGKALQRLLLFSGERGLQPPELPGTEQYIPKVKTKSAKTKKSKEAEPNGDNKDYASALLSAAAGLAAHSPGNDTAAESGLTGIELSPPTTTGPQWRFLGPTMMPNGQTYGDSRVIVSGRIAAIAVDPANPNHLLCGSAGGGVWQTFNKGVNWSPRTDYMPTLATGAIAFDPTTPSKVYCGTGEGNFYAGLGAGIMRSLDGGSTWAMLATNPFVGAGFYDIIVDKTNGNRLMTATTSGVHISTNGGVNWSLVKGGRCWDIAINPAGGNNAEILAAFSDGVYRTTNWGTAWAKLSLPGAPASFNRLAVDIARSNPSVAYAYGASGASCLIYRRSAAGGWSAVTPPAGLSTGQAWYDWFLGISPDNDSQIYLGAIEAYRGTLSGGSWAWVTISNKAGDDIHPDQHCIAIDTSNANNIYVGCDGGLFASSNRGTNWTSLNNGLGITEIEYLAQDVGSSRWIMGGTQDNGSIRYTGSSVWDHIADGDGGDCGVNRSNPNTCYHTYYSMGMERSDTKGNFGSFAWKGPNVPAGYSALFYPPLEVNNNVVAQAGQSVYISRNQADAWAQVALPAGNVASALAIPNTNTVFAGTTSGNVYKITWTGAAWSAAAALTTPRAGAFISDIYVNPANLNRIWVTYSSMGAGGRVFRSDNGGTSWTNLTAGLPNLPINAVEVDPGNPNRVWVAADVGVYQSFNAGVTWAAFANSLPNGIVADLIYHPHARVLRAGMRNRGVWEIPVNGWLANPVCGVQWTGSLAPNETRRWFTFNWPATWHMLWTVMPTTAIIGNPEITWKVQVERANPEFVTYWISVTNLTNQTVAFEGRYAILSYY